MTGMDDASWDERYAASHRLWSGEPNHQLVAEAAGLPPGRALDAGCGEGADAIWLAHRGWRVTAVDLSGVALQRAAAHGEETSGEVAARITWVHADLAEWAPAPASYDLVSAQFLHLPADQRGGLYRRLADAVAPGGALLIVGHHPSDLQTGIPRPRLPELYPTGREIAASLDPELWVVEVDAARARQTVDHDGRPVTIHDAVFKAQRTR
jgi:SAM-dependent methyltransferase